MTITDQLEFKNFNLIKLIPIDRSH